MSSRGWAGGKTIGDDDDDRPFIVLTETKPSKRHIPVWARYSPLVLVYEAHEVIKKRGGKLRSLYFAGKRKFF